jgi:dTDP-4-amino-4,6-dideoxygalactose transaminase
MQKYDEAVFVTKPNLPSLDKVYPYLVKIWEEKTLTNNGPFHKIFERKLAEYLKAENINLFCNGTLALMIGLQALRISGEVITTPFSFAATTHALKWNNISPVFCDIEENSLNIDHNKIEALITPKTTAILPVHVYGHPCDTNEIQNIADKYGLKVIYDAAHAFGVRLNDKNLFLEGDMSILSFHGTKLFTTFEGGAVISKDEELKKRIDYLKNFGFADEVTVIAPGINAKMNEFQSVIGFLSLEIVEEEIANRKKLAEAYFERLKDIDGVKVYDKFDNYEYNYAYLPILIQKGKYKTLREEVYNTLKNHNIFSRRYFYPLISNMPPYRSLSSANKENLPTANKIADQILCLPLYGSLDEQKVHNICMIIKSVLQEKL